MLNGQKDKTKLRKPSRSFQSNQPIPNPSRARSVQPVVRTDRSGQQVVETNTENALDGCQTRFVMKV